jgi:hypothetical protein
VKIACERLSQRTSQAVMANQCLFELAAEDGDTAAMRLHAAELARLATSHEASAFAVAAALRVALLDDDRRALDSLWQEADAVADSAGNNLEGFMALLLDGRGLAGLDQFLLSEADERPDGWLPGSEVLYAWARARGRYPEWAAVRDRIFEQRDPAFGNRFSRVMRLRDALFLGEPEDSAVLAAAAWFDSVATGAIEMPNPVLRSIGRCWDTMWKAAHGDTRGARETVRHVQEIVDIPDLCTFFIDVYVAESEGVDFPSAVARLDSLVRPGWIPGGHYLTSHHPLTPVANLFLSRVLVQAGDTAGALRAARRGKPREAFSVEQTGGILIDHLREEARLAVMVGDTTGAVDAYGHYFKLRDTRPDHPPWAAQWDSMRVEYGALTGVETP